MRKNIFHQNQHCILYELIRTYNVHINSYQLRHNLSFFYFALSGRFLFVFVCFVSLPKALPIGLGYIRLSAFCNIYSNVKTKKTMHAQSLYLLNENMKCTERLRFLRCTEPYVLYKLINLNYTIAQPLSPKTPPFSTKKPRISTGLNQQPIFFD